MLSKLNNLIQVKLNYGVSTRTHKHTHSFSTAKLHSDCVHRSLCTKPVILLFRKPNKRILSSGIWCCVVCWKSTEISEEHFASIFRVEDYEKPGSPCHLLSSWFLSWLTLRPWRWRRHVPPKCRLTFKGLHNAISQKVELFITIAVRTKYPIRELLLSQSCEHYNTPELIMQNRPCWYKYILSWFDTTYRTTSHSICPGSLIPPESSH
jgi:hypothetical protein